PANRNAVSGIWSRRVSISMSGTSYFPAIFPSLKNGTGAATASAPSSASFNAAVSRIRSLCVLPQSPQAETSHPLSARISARYTCPGLLRSQRSYKNLLSICLFLFFFIVCTGKGSGAPAQYVPAQNAIDFPCRLCYHYHRRRIEQVSVRAEQTWS